MLKQGNHEITLETRLKPADIVQGNSQITGFGVPVLHVGSTV